MKLWIARDQSGSLHLSEKKPYRPRYIYGNFFLTNGTMMGNLYNGLFPEVTWENSPQQVEIKLIDNGN